MWNATFPLLTASLLQAMRSTGSGTALYIMVVCCDWCISIRLLFPCTMASSGEVSQSCSLRILLHSAMFCKYSLKIKGYTKIGGATPDTKKPLFRSGQKLCGNVFLI